MEQEENKIKVLFVCTHNSARSQMAEALLSTLYGDRYEVYSGGIGALFVHPHAIEAMGEIGIDISGYRSKSVDRFLSMDFDYVITLCDNAREACPYFPHGKETLHRSFPDPASVSGSEEEKLAAFRRVRDEIQAWITERFGGGQRGNRN
jgi:arsenate reductase (thioredoxin)